MTTAVIYARFSCSKQREASIDDQLRECRDYCKHEGIDVVGEYCDYAQSGRTDDRPQFQAMIANAGESDLVVVYMMDRFSRSEYDAPIYKRELSKHGVKLVSALEHVPDSPEGIIYEKLLEGLAACESKKTAIRVKRGMEGNALKGLPNGGKRMLGYRTVDGHTVIDEDEAAIVREVFKRRAEGECCNHIAASMASRGVQNAYHRPMTERNVAGIVKNRKYLGEVTWGGITTENAHEPIVSVELWEKANAARQAKYREKEEYRDYPLSGKATCAICGHNMVGESAHGGKGHKYHYYSCMGALRSLDHHIKRIRAEVLEESVVRGVRGLLADDETARHVAKLVIESKSGEAVRKRRIALQAEIRKADDAMANIIHAIEMGIIAPGIQDRIDKLTEAKRHAEDELLKVVETTVTVDEFMAFLQSATAMSDEQVIDCLVWSVQVDAESALVTLNWDIKKDEPARFELVRTNSEWWTIPTCVRTAFTVLDGQVFIKISKAA